MRLAADRRHVARLLELHRPNLRAQRQNAHRTNIDQFAALSLSNNDDDDDDCTSGARQRLRNASYATSFALSHTFTMSRALGAPTFSLIISMSRYPVSLPSLRTSPETYSPISIPADIALDGALSASVRRSQPLPDHYSKPLEERAIVVGEYGEGKLAMLFVSRSLTHPCIVSSRVRQRMPHLDGSARSTSCAGRHIGCPWSKPIDVWSEVSTVRLYAILAAQRRSCAEVGACQQTDLILC